ncbi:phosphatase PAP2 family protein [Zeaxanthinibacter enoshimensis]|uniref:Undecaprenyl-diphosphatase n=1 Tax=Zeaxanthinibacter enoshimensis TaxID=392009 RepID=A0A4R6TIR6_9FLAO|nr:phosphatase PAP2 family protein [Zeaxanthinibacter enoshimensis]TDQ30734.1 undecaprenyl-diphosphatase [Zeaxanthinibacter enoshimensis]
MLKKILEWDRETFIYLNSLGIERLDGFWSFVTNITTWIPLYILFFLLILLKHRRKEALFMSLWIICLLFFVVFLTDVTKEFVARLRPNNEEEINTLIRILKSPTNYSFFSGHAASSFSITTLVYLFLKDKYKWVWLFFLWPFIFAFSRIYVGVHYPVDILVGTFVGTASAFFFFYMYNGFIGPYLASSRHE